MEITRFDKKSNDVETKDNFEDAVLQYYPIEMLSKPIEEKKDHAIERWEGEGGSILQL